MVLRETGQTRWALRGDVFSTEDRSVWTSSDFGEAGWSVTAGWQYEFEHGRRLAAEVLHVDSDRPLRSLWGITADHSQTQFQLSWRIAH